VITIKRPRFENSNKYIFNKFYDTKYINRRCWTFYNIIIFLYFNKKNKSISIYFVDSHIFTGIEKISTKFFCRNSFTKQKLKSIDSITWVRVFCGCVSGHLFCVTKKFSGYFFNSREHVWIHEIYGNTFCWNKEKLLQKYIIQIL